MPGSKRQIFSCFNAKHDEPQYYNNDNYKQNNQNTAKNGTFGEQRHSTITQAISPKQYHQYQNHHQQASTWHPNMHQMASMNNIHQMALVDKEQGAGDSVVQVSTPPLNQEQEQIDDTHHTLTHQVETTTTNKRIFNDSNEFITVESKKAKKKAWVPVEQHQTTTSSTDYQHPNKYNVPIEQLQRAVVHNLPCFTIKFTQTDNLPAAMTVAEELYDYFKKNQIQLVEEFSVVRYNGIFLRIVVKNKKDYCLLCSAKNWPTRVLGINITLIIPKFVPEQFSLVVRFVAKEFSVDQVTKEVKRSASTATNFRQIVYPYPRGTNDFRFSVTDLKKYNGLLRLGHIGIGNTLRKITPYRPSNKLTYCTKCWQLNHTRNKCQEQGQKCRICLEDYNQQHNEICSKQYRCAQCHNDHYSLDSDCPEIQQHRRELNNAVKGAIKDGVIKRELALQIRNSSTQYSGSKNNNYNNDFPPLPSTTTSVPNVSHSPWTHNKPAANSVKQNDITNEQLFEKICSRFDSNMEQTNSRLTIIEKKIKSNEETIISIHKRLNNMVEILQL
ncbi:unnamed protein product [Adineta ricciae]|uniref:Uncharacterized protein n=1 Tax=Adineta ricciae TaxID=249248 RepID=A0A814CKG0_ADIRI|nr:unnamed protein product [Adineta ricciae]CAF1141995.1 unnamed protein product [Adineta ricciae]